jgi:hypothetical protein
VHECKRAVGQAREQLSEGERCCIAVLQAEADDDGTGHEISLLEMLSLIVMSGPVRRIGVGRGRAAGEYGCFIAHSLDAGGIPAA